MSEPVTSPAIYKAIIGVMKSINAIGKDSFNKLQGFKYRGIDDVMNELHTALANNGVFIVPEVLEEVRSTGKSKNGGDLYYTRLKIRFTFYAEDGSSVSSVVIGEAMDSGDKASNKALSIGLKYAMLQVFCIPTEEEKDPDAQSPQPQAGSMKKAPQVEQKGGPATQAESDRLNALVRAKYQNGNPVFTGEEISLYLSYRKDKTASELIAFIENALKNRMPDSELLK